MSVIAEEGNSPDRALIISKVRDNVASMHKRLPDLICNEDVTIRETETGKMIKEKHYRLSLRAVRRPHDSANQFSKSRDVISATINGKAVNESKYGPPLGLRGRFSQDLLPSSMSQHRFALNSSQ